MRALAIPFEDALEGQDPYPGGYPTTNESVTAWRYFVKGKRIRRAAGICSGGEIGLLSILPTVRDELILVDHSYGSLMYAMQKYLLIKKHGFDKALELLTPVKTKVTSYPYDHDLYYKKNPVFHSDPNPDLEKALKEVSKDLPPQISQGATRQGSFYRTERLGRDGNNCRAIEDQWKFTNAYERWRIAAKLDKVLFVHGGFQQLKDRGPFDLFYLSNAHYSGNGNKGQPDLSTVTECMRDGGWIIATTIYAQAKPKTWHEVDRISYNDKRVRKADGNINSWTYTLYQVRKGK